MALEYVGTRIVVSDDDRQRDERIPLASEGLNMVLKVFGNEREAKIAT